MKYTVELVLIKWVGTHEEYDAIDVTKIGLPVPGGAAKKARKKARKKKTR